MDTHVLAICAGHDVVNVTCHAQKLLTVLAPKVRTVRDERAQGPPLGVIQLVGAIAHYNTSTVYSGTTSSRARNKAEHARQRA